MSNKYQEALKRLRTNEYLTSREQREYYNLLQELVDKETPRTEQEILKDFEKLGYEVVCNSDTELVLEEEYYHNHFKRIHIRKQFRLYAKLQHLFNIDEPVNFDMQEHKLLRELFTLWRWL